MRIVFTGSGAIGLPALEFLARSTEHDVVAVVTQPDRPAGRGRALRASPVKELALAYALPLLQPERIREPGAVEELAAFSPDLLLVVAYGQILPKAVLEIPKIACLNLHASLLPKHRGAAPIQAAILSGDPETGMTVMYMDEGLDTGDILLQEALPIRADDTGGSLHDRLAEQGARLLGKALGLLATGKAPRTPQEDAQATYAPKLTRASGRLDWSRSAVELERQVRAMQPWPGSHSPWPGPGGKMQTLKIFAADVVSGGAGSRGTILRADETGIVVAAGEGALRLCEVQLEGRRRMGAGDFVRGTGDLTGLRLGE